MRKARTLPAITPAAMRLFTLLIFTTILASTPLAAGEPVLSGPAAELYRKAASGRYFAEASRLNPEILPTSDGASFFAVWKAASQPKRWIVSLHGSHGFATDDLAIWHRQVKDRDLGLVCVQWWLGTGESTTDYLTPEKIYREVDMLLRKLGVAPGEVMLHGFSRGSANSYAVAALDAGRGQHYFRLAVASSGGVGLGYPPNLAITAGVFGDHPLRGTRWVTVAGGRDPEPERDGIPGMRRAAEWLKDQGAIVIESIEDPTAGHGALQTNPVNARRVLDLFLKDDR